MAISEKKLAASRETIKKATQAWVDKHNALYEANPTFCKNCGTKLPRQKKNNKFCSSSCSAVYNNTGREKVAKYKCLCCDSLIKQGKFCSHECSGKHRVKYTDEERELVNKQRNREVSANYRAKIREQTPDDADRAAIREFYNNCPEGYEVDHIIPISKGGLHTLTNLQYLTITENRRKGNKIV